MCDQNPGMPLPSIEHSMHPFRVWLDENRPWLPEPGTRGAVYKAIEKMAAHAAWCFRSHVCPTQQRIDDLTSALYKFTELLPTHPDDYDGPCMCAECRSSG